jgi:hypothetical protein
LPHWTDSLCRAMFLISTTLLWLLLMPWIILVLMEISCVWGLFDQMVCSTRYVKVTWYSFATVCSYHIIHDVTICSTILLKNVVLESALLTNLQSTSFEGASS